MTILNTDAERLYLDFDSFFATAEQYFNPQLRGLPVGVVPLDTPHTGCIAVSREAKARGLKFGAMIKETKQAIPDMVFVVARPDAYVRLHNRILEVIETCLPIAEVRSIDEVVCHLLPSEATQADALARRIKTALAENFSPMLTCSIGIAKTELLAKIGAEMEKPDGLVHVPSADLPAILTHLALNDLPGISSGIEKRLNSAGIYDTAALWKLAPKQARAIWGNVEGERFWNGLHGLHVQRPETVKRMFGHSRMLPLNWRTPELVRVCARQLTMSAGRRLRRANMRASRMTVGLRGGGVRNARGSRKDTLRWHWEGHFRPARDDISLLRTLSKGLQIAEKEARFKPRSVSVMLHGLSPENEIHDDLFSLANAQMSSDNSTNSVDKWECVSETMDELRATHGPSSISLGPLNEIPGGYLGAKIAFGRIPDERDFNEAPTEDSATQFCSFA